MGDDGTQETRSQRVNRELVELLNEVRVALPGVQILFGFLLVAPFNTRFETISPTSRVVFFASFVATTISSICLIAPASHHRLRFRDPDKESMLFSASRFALGGIAALGLAIVGVSYVFVHMVLRSSAGAAIVVAALTGCIAWAWYVVPMMHRIRRRKERGETGHEKWK